MSMSLIIVCIVCVIAKLDSSMAVWAVGVTESVMQIFCGFFKPYDIAHIGYKIVYCGNPEFWFFSAMVNLNLASQERDCPSPPLSPLKNQTIRNDFALLNDEVRMNDIMTKFTEETGESVSCKAFSPKDFLKYNGYDDMEPYMHLIILICMKVVFITVTLLVLTNPFRPKGMQSVSRSVFKGAKALDDRIRSYLTRHSSGPNKLGFELYVPGVATAGTTHAGHGDVMGKSSSFKRRTTKLVLAMAATKTHGEDEASDLARAQSVNMAWKEQGKVIFDSKDPRYPGVLEYAKQEATAMKSVKLGRSNTMPSQRRVEPERGIV